MNTQRTDNAYKMKLSTLFLRVIIVLVTITTFISCSDPLTPIPPVWDTNVNVPLLSQSYTLQDLLNKNQSIQYSENGEGVLLLQKNFPLKSILVGDSLRLDETTFQVSRTLGLLSYDIPNVFSKEVSLASTFSQLSNGTYVVSPVTNSTLVDVIVDVRQYFESLTFADGQINLEVKNNFPIPLTFPQPLKLNDSEGLLLGYLTLPATISPNQSVPLSPISLKGMKLTGVMKISLHVASPGSNGIPVTIDRSQSISVTASIVNTKIEKAVAIIPDQETVYEQKINLSEQGIRIQTGEIKSGSIECTLKNYIPVGATVDLQMQGIEQNGAPVHRSITIDPRASQQLSIALAGMTLNPINETELKYIVRVKTSNSGQSVSLQSTDSVNLVAKLKDVRFKYVSGKVETRNVDINQSQNIDFALKNNISGAFKFTGARMWVGVQNGVALPVELRSGQVTGINTRTSLQATVTLPYTKIQARASNNIVLDNNEVLNFLNTFGAEFPNKFTITSKAVINPDNSYGTVYDTDSLAAQLFIEIPLKFSLKDGSMADTTRITLDKDNKKRLGEVKTGTLHFSFENGLPIGVHVEPEILDDQYNVLINAASINVAPIEIPAASVDQTGRVTNAKNTNIELKLGETDFSKLIRSQYAKVKIYLNTQGTDPVIFRSTDFIKMRAYATLNFNTSIATK